MHEAHYNRNGDLCLLTKDPVYITGEKLDEIYSAYRLMKHAFDKPVIDFDTVVFHPTDTDLDDQKK